MQYKLVIYGHPQKEYSKIMSVINNLPELARKLPYHLYIAQATPIHAIKQEAIELLWHQRLIHCGAATLKDLHKHVDGIPNLNNLKFNDIDKCATCL